MLTLVLRRLLTGIPTMLAITCLLFFGAYWLLGSPAALLLGQDATPEAVAALNARHGFDRPVHEQYLQWLGRALQGNLGTSLVTGQSVSTSLAAAFPITFELTFWSILLATILAVSLNTFIREDSWGGRLLTGFIIFGITVPNFMLGIGLIFIFSVSFGMLPTVGWLPWGEGIGPHLRAMAMPVLTLTAYYFGTFSIVYRSEYSEVGRRLFMRVARAKGMSEGRLALRHGLPNAFLPVMTLIGLSAGQLMGGAVVTETVFSMPGIGRLFVSAITARDFPVILAVGTLTILAVILFNIITDIFYAVLNPQVRAG